ncbi:MAG: D-alanyl-D-alanine carboxypeptidase/D-alanyl-D-alanine endopeptidase [Chitinophagales bacterium]
MNRVIYYFTIILILHISCVSAQSDQHQRLKQNLDKAIEVFENDSETKNALWGFHAKMVENGRILASHNADRSLVPASTLKTVTTAAALSILGSDFTFKTKLEYDGYIDEQGTLHGNLYITGGGDPTLATNRSDIATHYKSIMKKWLSAVQQQGIRKIEGHIIGDASFFGTEIISPKWLWEDTGNYYGAGASGLSFHENRYDIIFDTGKKWGESTKLINVIPEVPDVEFINTVTTASATSGDNAYVYGVPYNNVFYIRGTLPSGKSGFPVRGAVPEPALFCAHNLMKYLKTKGNVKCEKGATTIRKMKLDKTYKKSKKTSFHTIESPPLSKIVFWTNKRSINLFAESILRMVGKREFGKATPQNGIKAVKKFWENRSVQLDGFLMYDGSGLSPINAISTKQLANMMAAYKYDSHYQDFFNSLPVAGKSSDVGFLKSFMRSTAAAGKMHIKSGYLNNKRGYTGYTYTKSGELVAFAVLVNHYTCSNTKMKKKIEKMIKVLAE